MVKLDFLFNNAGIGLAGETFDIPITAWEKIIDVDIDGVVNPADKLASGGSIQTLNLLSFKMNY